MILMEKRVNQRLLHYWEDIRGKRRFPAEQDIDPEALEDIWDDMFLIQVRKNGEKIHGFQYSYMGHNLIKAYGANMTGQDIYDALISTQRDTLIHDLNKVMENQRPLLQEGSFENIHHLMIKYRRILCPLGEKDSQVDFIIGAMRWKTD